MVCNYQSSQLRLAAVPVLCEVYGKCPTASLLNSDWLHWLQRHLFFNPLLIIWLSKLFCVGFFSSFIVLTVQHCVWKKLFNFPDVLQMIVQQAGPFSGFVECGFLKLGRVSVGFFSPFVCLISLMPLR